MPSAGKCQFFMCDSVDPDTPPHFSRCALCDSPYCSKEHQKSDWRRGCHKETCAQIKAYRDALKAHGGDASTFVYEFDKDAAAQDSLRAARVYLCPLAVRGVLGGSSTTTPTEGGDREIVPGFVLVRSEAPIADFHWRGPSAPSGRPLDRELMAQFVPLPDFDAVVAEMPGLAGLRGNVEEACASCDYEKRCVVLAVFGCGYATLLQIALMPDFNICRTLATDGGPQHDRILINIDRKDAGAV